MFNIFKRKKPDTKELYPGVPITDGTNDFLLLYSTFSKKELIATLAKQKQQVVDNALTLTITNYRTYNYNMLIEDIKYLSYSIKAIELLLRVRK